MEVNFKICNTEHNSIQITDLTQQLDEYLPEESNEYIRLGKFKYSDCYTVNMINYKSTKDKKLLKTIITPHVVEGEIVYLDEAYYKTEKDGHYVIDHIIIPSVEWFNSQEDSPNNILHEYTSIYLTDGKQFYKGLKEGSDWVTKEVTDKEILEVNSEGTTLSKAYKDFFSICYVYQCYINHCKDIFEATFNKCFNSSINTFNRDFVWMAINIMTYYVERGLLEKAQSIIEELFDCSGLCTNIINKESYDCGCGKAKM